MEYAYPLILALIVAPSMAVNRIAAIVVACWLPGQLVWLLGAPSAPLDMAVDIVAIGVSAALSRSTADFIVTGLFFPMAVVNMADGMQSIHSYYAWWLLFYTAMIQAIVVPFGNDWTRARQLISGAKRRWKTT